MTYADLEGMTMAEIKEALAEAKVELPENVEDMKKPVLVALAAPHLVSEQTPESEEEVVEEVAEEEAPEPEPIPEEEVDLYSQLVKHGFEDKADVENYLKAITREKANHKARLDELDKREKILEEKETKNKKRERDIDETAVKLQAKLQEAKKQTEIWTKLKAKVLPHMND